MNDYRNQSKDWPTNERDLQSSAYRKLSGVLRK
jgi:hypothetical protein